MTEEPRPILDYARCGSWWSRGTVWRGWRIILAAWLCVVLWLPCASFTWWTIAARWHDAPLALATLGVFALPPLAILLGFVASIRVTLQRREDWSMLAAVVSIAAGFVEVVGVIKLWELAWSRI